MQINVIPRTNTICVIPYMSTQLQHTLRHTYLGVVVVDVGQSTGYDSPVHVSFSSTCDCKRLAATSL